MEDTQPQRCSRRHPESGRQVTGYVRPGLAPWARGSPGQEGMSGDTPFFRGKEMARMIELWVWRG